MIINTRLNFWPVELVVCGSSILCSYLPLDLHCLHLPSHIISWSPQAGLTSSPSSLSHSPVALYPIILTLSALISTFSVGETGSSLQTETLSNLCCLCSVFLCISFTEGPPECWDASVLSLIACICIYSFDRTIVDNDLIQYGACLDLCSNRCNWQKSLRENIKLCKSIGLKFQSGHMHGQQKKNMLT